MRIFFQILFLVFLLTACGSKEEKKAAAIRSEGKTEEKGADSAGWEEILPSVVKLDSYDGERILESGQGFFVENQVLVTRYSLVSQATKVWITPFDENKRYLSTKFVAVDRINDLILLKVEGLERKPVELFPGTAPGSAKSIYISSNSGKTIQLFTGKVLNLTTARGSKLYRITNRIRKSYFGAPVFVSSKKVIGVGFSGTVNYEMQSFATPSFLIKELMKNRLNAPVSLEELRVRSNQQTAAENRKIKALVLETDWGDITIRLFNETPDYRDNFIRLAKEHYYDSLLIHRVIKDFGIQSGAADTRYAEEGDNVGWKGPGYTLPAHIVRGKYHKRGMIGSPRKPDTKNRRRRSDGSQFYIVSGRKYFDNELDELEETNNYTFSKEQREAYKNVGGAPHLDGTYTIFGEVLSGMDVVDQIVKTETDRRWRPLKDIRLKTVRFIK